jgi:YidC/Oxa1 family membrane protein insertase
MIKTHIFVFLLHIFVLFFTNFAHADIKEITTDPIRINSMISKSVKAPFSYSGLAAFYNGVAAYVIDDYQIERLDEHHWYTLTSRQSLAIVGHHNILLAKNINADVLLKGNKLVWKNNDNKQKIHAKFLLKSDLSLLPKPLQKLRFNHLWEPFRLLCIATETLLLWLHSIHTLGWGVTVILLSIVVKIILLPLSFILIKSQRKISYMQALLTPKLEAINENFSGEEAHKKFMAVHKENGVTPFYTLKPLLLTLLPVIFSIAIFNVLGELDLVAGHGFLWINDLATPDVIFDHSFQIPMLGSSVNLLPVLMTFVTILAALLHQNKIICKKELRKQKIRLYIMAFGFFILFYPFPSVMVLYWTFSNAWQIIQQKFVRV